MATSQWLTAPDEDTRQRLERDLRDAGISPVSQALLDEVQHATLLRPHEGDLPGFGAIIADEDTAVPDKLAGTEVDFEHVARLRELADGSSSFVERRASGSHLRLLSRAAQEIDLVEHCRGSARRVVRLRPDGTLQVIAAGRIWTRHRSGWRSEPTADTVVAHLRDAQLPPGIDAEVLRGLLQLAVHTLSAHQVGATLVLLPDWDRTGCARDLDAGGSTPLLPVADRSADGAIANLLRQHDGAALISPDGSLWWAGAELAGPPPTGASPVAGSGGDGGMRHRSAARFSKLRPDAVVVVVSGDGPVSLFVAGEDIAPPEAEADLREN